MPEEVLFEAESNQSRADVAAYLRQVADALDGGDAITLRSGGESVTMEPPETVEFEVKAEREGPTDADGELSVEFELEWPENAPADGSAAGSLEIE
jgi:amphi-Trp domain-containing protein